MFCWIWRLHHICLLFLTQLNIKSCLRVFHGLSIIKCKVKGARCSFSVWPLAGSKPSSYWCAHHAQATILILIRRKAPLSPTVSAYRKQKLCFSAFRRIMLLLCIYTIIKITPHHHHHFIVFQKRTSDAVLSSYAYHCDEERMRLFDVVCFLLKLLPLWRSGEVSLLMKSMRADQTLMEETQSGGTENSRFLNAFKWI